MPNFSFFKRDILKKFKIIMFKTLTDAKLYKDAGYKAFVTGQWVANNACGLIQTSATAIKDYALPVAIASANSASEFYHNMPEETRNHVRNAALLLGVSTVAFAASRVAKTMGTSTNGPAKKQRIENVSPTEANEGVQFKSTNLTADNNSIVSKVTSTTTTTTNNNNNDITTTKIATTAEQEQLP